MTKKQAVSFGVVAILLLSGWGASKEQSIAGDKKQSKNFNGTLETWKNPPFPVDNISIEKLISKISLYVKPAAKKAKKKPVTKAAAAAAEAAQAAKEAATAAKQASKSAKKIARGEKTIDQKAIIDVAQAAQAAADAAQAAADAAKAVTATVAPQKTSSPTEHVLEKDPKTSLIEFELDLVEVDEIKTPHPDEVWTWQKEKGYRKLEFVEIEVISKGTPKTKSHYLIEKDRKIFCDKIDPAGPGEQKVPITAIKSLKIEGYKDRDLEERKRKQEEEREKIKRLAEKAK